MTRADIERQIVEISHRLHARGWVANHDGNVTARLSDGRIVATPTAVSKGDVRKSWLIVVDKDGKKVSGQRKSFSEMALHLLVYRQRPDAMAVLHSHAPHATALSVAGAAVSTRMLAESVVSLGDEVPLVAYASPKSPDFTLNLLPYLQQVDAVVLQNHGVLSWGPDLETAYLRMELVEHLARIQLLALQAGGAREIPSDDRPALLAARAKAGLGPSGRAQDSDTAALVRAEVVRALRG